MTFKVTLFNNPCSPTTCQNGGTCYQLSSLSTLALCVCTHNFSGTFCEIAETFCTSNPCLNGGTCLSTGRCLCQVAFTGVQCESSYTCINFECPTGQKCAIAANLFPTCISLSENTCLNSPCLNGGVCLASTGKCSCPLAFTGASCETSYYCGSSSCPYGQKCYIGVNGLPFCKA